MTMHPSASAWFSACAVVLAALVGTLSPARVQAAVEQKDQFGVQIDFYEDARASLEAGEVEAAVIHLKNLLAEKPGYLPARILLGRAQLEAGRPAAAVKELLLARESGADEHLVRVPLVSAYLLGRQYQKVLDEARRPGAAEADRVGLLVLAGDALLALEKLEDAQASFVQASSLAPADPAPLIGQARVLLAREELPRAAATATRAVRLAPDSVTGWHILGEIGVRVGTRAARWRHTTAHFRSSRSTFRPCSDAPPSTFATATRRPPWRTSSRSTLA